MPSKNVGEIDLFLCVCVHALCERVLICIRIFEIRVRLLALNIRFETSVAMALLYLTPFSHDVKWSHLFFIFIYPTSTRLKCMFSRQCTHLVPEMHIQLTSRITLICFWCGYLSSTHMCERESRVFTDAIARLCACVCLCLLLSSTTAFYIRVFRLHTYARPMCALGHGTPILVPLRA